MLRNACGCALLVVLLASAMAQAAEPAAERTPLLADWEALKYGMFIHYGMSTFTASEIDNGAAPAATYAPTNLDVAQWVRVAKDAGMKYIILTAKHVAGFCLWDSEGYDYDVAGSPVKTDVIADFLKACKAEGIKPGLYYCVLDGHNEGGVKWQAAVDEKYFALIKRHLTELHTRYPGIFEQWIDIPMKLSPAQRTELYQLVKRLSPNCLVMMNCGFTDGAKVQPGCWPTDLVDGERTLPPPEGHKPLKEIAGKTFYIPMEVCDTLTANWFWLPNDPPKSVRALHNLYSNTVGRGANLLLDVPPDKTGRIPQDLADCLVELKKVIDNPSLLPPPESLTYGGKAKASNVYRKDRRWNPEFAVDDDPTTRWACDDDQKQAWLEVDLGKPATFSRAMIAEAYPKRVQSFELQYKDGDAWKTFARGTTIGEKWTAEFEPVTAQVVRLTVLEATVGPTIWEFQLYPPKRK
jgi:alpha-L-fucosidase